MKIIKIVLLLCLPVFVMAQNKKPDSVIVKQAMTHPSEPDIYLITADTAINIALKPNYWRILGDKEGRLSFEQVNSAAFHDRFYQYDSAKAIDYSIHTIWYKYHLKNNLSHTVSLCVYGDAEYNDQYYLDSAGKWKHQKNGWRVPYSERDGLQRIGHMPVIIEAGKELILYERRNYTWRVKDQMEAHIDFTETLIKKRYIDDNSFFNEALISGFLFGLCLITCLINIMFYRVIKEIESLYYALFIISVGGTFFNSQLFNGLFKEYPLLNNCISNITLSAWFFFLMQFIRTFFRTKQYFPRWDKLLICVNIITLFTWYLTYVVNNQPLEKFQIFSNSVSSIPYLFMDFIFITLLLFMRKRNRQVNTIIIAAVPIFIIWGPVYTITQFFSIKDLLFHTHTILPAWLNWIWQSTTLVTLLGLLWLIIIFSTLLFRRYSKLLKDLADEAYAKERIAKEKEIEKNILIAEKNAELEEKVITRTQQLEHTMETMRATQKQLIESEKMASLGELTAGIAHEIQNPLNFVNNFSEVNTELIGEMEQEIDKGNLTEVKAIAKDIKENEQKINHHGKRADAIVKGMLQHSRSSSGVKEPTDINALADEYLRLAYHGLRAKDKSFNATLITDFDDSVGMIDMVPQDMGRVILNLINNAFYAVDEKKKQSDDAYEPTVTITSKNIVPLPGGPQGVKTVQLSVKDNGNGIPKKVLDKIFQPFFTTKPTGQGTGLGLSLSYDIVKAHGGELKVETEEGSGTKFIIQLPFKFNE